LLLETNYSVDEIALKVGYQNINHFYCQFRDYYQNTPRAWRQAQRCKLGHNQILQPLEGITS
ncbi:helix-turn-helix domain-containing protein, partial [Nodularia sphaerocarpa]